MVASSNNTHTTVFVIGKMGMGKSTLGNTLTGGNFETSEGTVGCTTTHRSLTGNGFTYHDTPGDGD
jgi:predicted GTPase